LFESNATSTEKKVHHSTNHKSDSKHHHSHSNKIRSPDRKKNNLFYSFQTTMGNVFAKTNLKKNAYLMVFLFVYLVFNAFSIVLKLKPSSPGGLTFVNEYQPHPKMIILLKPGLGMRKEIKKFIKDKQLYVMVSPDDEIKKE